MSLFRDSEFTSAAGLTLPWKIECDALTDGDWRCLARIVAKRFQFGQVVAVPTGGESFAEALRPHCTPGCQTTLVVDDVLTTGDSIRRARSESVILGPVVGVVVFARGTCPWWVYPLFTLNAYWNDEHVP